MSIVKFLFIPSHVSIPRHNHGFGNSTISRLHSRQSLQVALRTRSHHVRMCAPATSSSSSSSSSSGTSSTRAYEELSGFIEDAGQLGTMRFIAISNGVVLETIGRLDYKQSRFEIGDSEYLSIASIDKTFECHINVSKVHKVTLSNSKAKIGGHDLHVIRLLDQEGTILLSCLLQYDPSQGPGHYLYGAVDSFNHLVQKYGPSFTLT